VRPSAAAARAGAVRVQCGASLVDWKGETGSRAVQSVSGHYSRGARRLRLEANGLAVSGRCREREYLAQRPRARRGLPSHYVDRGCGC